MRRIGVLMHTGADEPESQARSYRRRSQQPPGTGDPCQHRTALGAADPRRACGTAHRQDPRSDRPRRTSGRRSRRSGALRGGPRRSQRPGASSARQPGEPRRSQATGTTARACRPRRHRSAGAQARGDLNKHGGGAPSPRSPILPITSTSNFCGPIRSSAAWGECPCAHGAASSPRSAWRS